MNEGLSLALFVGSIFALIALYIAFLSNGTKMSFFVFHVFHLILWLILFIGATNYFPFLISWTSSVYSIISNISAPNTPYYLGFLPFLYLVTFFCVEPLPRNLYMLFFYSLFSVAVFGGLIYVTALVVFSFRELLTTFVFKLIFLVSTLLIGAILFALLGVIVKIMFTYSASSELSTTKGRD